jgi:protein TonB
MKTITILAVGITVLAGCASRTPDVPVKSARTDRTTPPVAVTSHGIKSKALTLSGYKRDVALHITNQNNGKSYSGRPQALLRSVIVVKYIVDADGRVVRSEILRSNRDRATEATALESLRSASPLPRPATHLLRRGQVESVETWLFNNDGRFQLRTIAQPQMDS